jgi:hypothetical protein
MREEVGESIKREPEWREMVNINPSQTQQE